MAQFSLSLISPNSTQLTIPNWIELDGVFVKDKEKDVSDYDHDTDCDEETNGLNECIFQLKPVLFSRMSNNVQIVFKCRRKTIKLSLAS